MTHELAVRYSEPTDPAWPEAYLTWFARQGFPEGKLGMLLENALTVKSNGLTPLVRELVERGGHSTRSKI